MKKKITILSAFLFSVFFAHAQVALEWASTYRFSAQQFDYGREIKVDNTGNVYVGGHTLVNNSQEGIITILKYDPFGNLIWEFHSPVMDLIEDMVMDESGNIYYTGARWNDSSAEWDFLTGMIDSNGASVWTTLYDGNGIGAGWDYAWGISIDASRNVYVTGHSQGTFNGYDWVTVKYNSSGVEQWVARYENPDNAGLGSNYDNDVFEVEPDKDGNVYVSGYTFNGSTHELTLVKYDSSGTQLWEKDIDTKAKWPTTNINKNYMKLDSSGNIFLLGQIQDSLNSADLLLVKFDPAGTLSWMTTWNSASNDSDYTSGGIYVDEALAIDQIGNAFICGVTSHRTIQFREDIVTVKYDPFGNEVWSNVFNGIGNDEDRAYGFTLDSFGNPYVTGSSYFTPNIGDVDYITYKIDGSTGLREWEMTFDGAGAFYDQAHDIEVDQQNNVYVTGWSAINNDPFDLHGEISTLKYSQNNTGISDKINPSFMSYPNPCNGVLNIILPSLKLSDLTIIISDNLGKTVTPEVTLRNAGVQLNTSRLSNGIYFLRIQSPSELYTGKFSVQH